MGIRDRLRGWLGVGALERRFDLSAEDGFRKRSAMADDVRSATHRMDLIELAQARTEIIGIPEVKDPIYCPNHHSGLVLLQLIEEVSGSDGSLRKVIGGGYYCPTCQVSFYHAGGRSWRPTAEQPASVEPAPGPAPAPPGPRLKFGPTRRIK